MTPILRDMMHWHDDLARSSVRLDRHFVTSPLLPGAIHCQRQGLSSRQRRRLDALPGAERDAPPSVALRED